MLDGGSYMKSGWVYGLKLHAFSSEGTQFVVMAKGTHVLIHHAVSKMELSQRMSAGFYHPAIILHQN